ncbi:MAG: methyl-accepting chemotaxis protein [Gallionellaceae bacterium]|jgi:methyl-accepting chemotaxis protein
MFKDMKVAVKLGMGFGVVLLLMLVILIAGMTNMASMNSATDQIVNDRYPKTVLVNEVIAKTFDNGRSTRNLLLLDDAAGIEKNREIIQNNRAKIKEALDKLDKSINTPKGRELMSAILQQRDALDPKYEELISLANSDRKAAIEFQMKDFAPTNSAYAKALHDMAEFQGGLMEKEGVAAGEAYTSARTLMVSLGIAAALAGMVMAFMITSSLTTQLGGEPAYAAEVVSKIANGDMTVNVEVKPGDNSSMLAAIRGMVEKLSQIIGEVNAAATNIASASEEVSSTAQSMSQATNEQAASVEETSASVEQMGASINQNSENAKVTEGIASQAAKQAAQGGEAVKETVTAMKQIAGKIGIIDDIAYQTNLLALNAAIEAARAGEHGKGFAVVAAEVRKLAERSQVAAQEIGELASGSVSKAEDAGKLLEEMVPAIGKTSDLVQEITAASEEQSSGASQINTAMSQLNTITQQNASATEELAATAEEMSSQAETLQQLMSFFRVGGGSAVAVKHQAFHPAASKPVAKPAKGGATKLAFAHASHDEAEFVKF